MTSKTAEFRQSREIDWRLRQISLKLPSEFDKTEICSIRSAGLRKVRRTFQSADIWDTDVSRCRRPIDSHWNGKITNR